MSDYLKQRERERKLERIRGKANGNGNGRKPALTPAIRDALYAYFDLQFENFAELEEIEPEEERTGFHERWDSAWENIDQDVADAGEPVDYFGPADMDDPILAQLSPAKFRKAMHALDSEHYRRARDW